MRVLVMALLICALVGGSRPPLGARDRPPTVAAQVADTPHTPPVDAPIIDPFRPPSGPYAPGNRGLEYDTVPGQTVRASSAGTVTFAGQVGGYLFVTIRHSPTLRTTVGFVDEVLVVAGERVVKGEVIALAGHTIHFTARQDRTYIDPELLFQHYRVVVRLVADPTTT